MLVQPPGWNVPAFCVCCRTKWMNFNGKRRMRKENQICSRLAFHLVFSAVRDDELRRVLCTIMIKSRLILQAKSQVLFVRFHPPPPQPLGIVVKIHFDFFFWSVDDFLGSRLCCAVAHNFTHMRMRLKFCIVSNWMAKPFWVFSSFEFELVLTMHLVVWHDMTADCWLLKRKQVRRSLP